MGQQRKAVTFNVSPEAYAKAKELFPDVVGTEDNLLQLIHGYKYYLEHKDDQPGASEEEWQKKLEDLKGHFDEVVASKDTEIAGLNDRIKDLEAIVETKDDNLVASDEEYKSLSNRLQEALKEREELVSRISALETDGALTWDNFKKMLMAFPVALLEETAARLSAYYDREIKPVDILTDMFLRYTIERRAEWFYPFVLKDDVIVRIAQQINPDVQSVRQIKKSLNFD